MKSLTQKINEAKGGANALYSEVQNQLEHNAAYHTLDVEEAMTDYKYGFVTLNSEEGYISLVSFNTPADFADLVDENEGAFDELEKIKVKESKEITSESGVKQTWFRMW